MPGRIDWNVTYVSDDDADLLAEVYDEKDEIVQSKVVPCKPPVNCPFTIDNLAFGTYTAAIAVGANRYYYVEGQQVITQPIDSGNASLIGLDEMNPIASVTINVNLT